MQYAQVSACENIEKVDVLTLVYTHEFHKKRWKAA